MHQALAAGMVDQNGFIRHQPPAPEQVSPDRERGFRQRRGFDHRQARGHRQALPDRRDGKVRVTVDKMPILTSDGMD